MKRTLFSLVACIAVATTPALAQPDDGENKGKDDNTASESSNAKSKATGKAKGKAKGKAGKRKEKLFDLTAVSLDGSTRMPQLLYFLERASAELERASLKRRSFVPEMVRSLDEDAL